MPKKRSGFCGFVSGKIQINLLSQGVGAPVRRDVRVEVGPCDADHDRELGVDAMLVHLDAGLLECPGNGEIAVNGAKHAVLGKVAIAFIYNGSSFELCYEGFRYRSDSEFHQPCKILS